MLRRLLPVVLAIAVSAARAFGAAPPAPSFRAVSTDGAAVDTAPTGNKPTGTVEGDLMLAYLAFVNTASVTAAPSGWTLIGSEHTFGSVKSRAYYKLVGDEAGTTTYAWTLDSSVQWFVRIASYKDVDVATPLDVDSFNSGTGTTVTATGITTTIDNALLVFLCASDAGGPPSFTPPSGMTEDKDLNGAELANVLQASAGASGDKSATASASGNWGARLVALRPSTGVRFYIDGAATPAISPSFGTEWDDTGTAVRRVGNSTKGSSAKADAGQAETSTSANRDQLSVQVVIGPLGGGTLSGSFKAQFRSTESSASMNEHSQILVRIVNSGGTETGVAFAGDTSTGTTNPTNEFGTTSANRKFTRESITRHLTSTSYSSGDYLVVEVGGREHNTSATSFTSTIRIGESSTDFAEDDTDTADNCPWIQFDSGVTLQTATCRTFVSMMGVGCH